MNEVNGINSTTVNESHSNVDIKNVPTYNILNPTTNDISKPKTKIVEEIVADASGLPKLIKKEVLIEDQKEDNLENTIVFKNKKNLILKGVLIFLVLGILFYFLFIYTKGGITFENITINKEEQAVIEEPILNKDDFYIYYKRDTGVVVLSNVYTKAYKLLGTYKCVSINKCVGLVGNKEYALIKDNEDIVLYNILKTTSEKMSSEYSKYSSAKFKVDKSGTTKGIEFTDGKNEKYYEIKEVEE